MNSEQTLPYQWTIKPLTDLGKWTGGGTPSKSNDAYWTSGSIPWVSPKDMKRLRIDYTIDYITDAALEESSAKLIQRSSVLMVTRSGILSHTFPVAINSVPVALNQDMKALTPSEGVEASYLAYYLISRGQDILRTCSKDGTTVSSIDSHRLGQYPVTLAPTEVQPLVTSKIEELFSCIDEGERALTSVEKLIESYRQAVLKAAVTGELTRDWRSRNVEHGESGEELIQRLLDARRNKWEHAELEKMSASGKTPRGDGWKAKYKEPAAPDTSELEGLPQGWVWASLAQLGDFGRGKSKHRPRNDPKLFGGPYPFLQTGTVRASKGRISHADSSYSELGLAQSKLWPAGTVCITIAANIAASGILQLDACFPDSVVGLVPADGVRADYVEFFIRTARDELDRYAPATAQKNINLQILEQVAVPLPPTTEQDEIFSRAQALLSNADNVEATLHHALNQSAGLKQSVLRSAFKGELIQPSNQIAADV